MARYTRAQGEAIGVAIGKGIKLAIRPLIATACIK